MKAKVDLIGQQSIFTNDDKVTAEVIVKRSHDDPYFSDLVGTVQLRLVCEGHLSLKGIGANGSDSQLTIVKYYESEPINCMCNYSTRGHVIYSGQLQFPKDGYEYPSSIVYDESRNRGIRWCVRAFIERSDIGECHIAERSCMFRPTSPLPSFLDLVDVEHSELVDDCNLTLITTHATAGLPQVPLTAGLSFSIRCQIPGKYALIRLRILLHEINEVFVDGCFRSLPVRRWLLDDIRCRNSGVKLDSMVTDLDPWVGDVHLDHATIAPTFETDHFKHNFDLVVEATVAWPVNSRSVVSKKVSSISPINVLPRINKSWTSPSTNPAPPLSPNRSTSKSEHPQAVLLGFDPAEITDTSSEESETINEDDDEEEEDESFYALGTDTRRKLSSNSVGSVFSAHLKLDEDKLNSLPSITTTFY